MESLQQLYRIGAGPSSSHTMGPKFAATAFLKENPAACTFRVTLYESLAATGKGHLTDVAILEVLGEDRTELIWRPEESLPQHPNAMKIEGVDKNGNVVAEQVYFSVGGGAVYTLENYESPTEHIYPKTTLTEIMERCAEKGITYWEYVFEHEAGMREYLGSVWTHMTSALDRGLATQGVLPGGIGLRRQAWNYRQRAKTASTTLRQTGVLTAYALATSEENSGGGTIVTAPTCGACGVLPAVLRYLQENNGISDADIIKALATAGIFGNVLKHNASISGAEVGCQGEVGSACAMAAAAACQLLGGSLRQIEYAAEMGLEHHLGLTCDPVGGLVQIPCIERNAYAATRAVSCAEMAILSDGSHYISFDEVASVMMQTGRDLLSPYRETSTGGLAKIYAERSSTLG